MRSEHTILGLRAEYLTTVLPGHDLYQDKVYKIKFYRSGPLFAMNHPKNISFSSSLSFAMTKMVEMNHGRHKKCLRNF